MKDEMGISVTSKLGECLIKKKYRMRMFH